MITAMKILVLLVVLGCIIWPYVLRRENGRQQDPRQARLQELLEEKEHAYAAIKELDFDYKMDKLSADDYQELSRQYKQKAVAILQEIDRLGNAAGAGSKTGG